MIRVVRRLAAIAALLLVLLPPLGAAAHPHVFVDARAEVVFDGEGRIDAVRHIWQFDAAFSAYATVNLDADGDGALSDVELAPLAKVNVDSLAEFGFFTWLTVDEVDADFVPPTEYWLEMHGERLTLFYTLPLTVPVRPGARTMLEVFDPEYFVAFAFVEQTPVLLDGAPAGCRASYRPPGELDMQTMTILGQIPADQRELPPDLRDAASALANLITIDCPVGAAAPVAATEPRATPVAGTPFGVATPDSTGGGRWFGGPLGPMFVWIAERQSRFYRALTDAFAGIKADGRAFWLLLGLSFLYGIFHAAGPGHGKAVITSYLFATGETVRRGIAIAFAAAFVQALTAILLIALAALVFRAAAFAMARTTEWVTIASYGLIVAVGAWLLWSKTVGGHRHVHHHGHHGGHAPHDDRDDGHPGDFAATAGGRGAAALPAIFAVGLRPCSGALIVLVFALSQGLFAVGVAATFVMALGTGLTVAVLIALAVSAKGLAVRLAGPESRLAVRALGGIEIAAAALVLLLGLLLLGGALANGLP